MGCAKHTVKSESVKERPLLGKVSVTNMGTLFAELLDNTCPSLSPEVPDSQALQWDIK